MTMGRARRTTGSATGRGTGRGTLIVFAKEPRLGRVKSRLAAGIGAVAATAWYRRALAHTLRRLDGGTCSGPVSVRRLWRLVLAVAPDASVHRHPWPAPARARRWHVVGQGNGDIGQRMARALDSAPAGPAVLVGSDIPGLRAEHVARAFRALGAGAEVVFGPATDGGFWLVGVARRRRLALFRDVRWSSEHTLADAIAALPESVAVALVDTLQDVDEAKDLDAARDHDR
jgi:rSAM/selenodomain-associated transferase 1